MWAICYIVSTEMGKPRKWKLTWKSKGIGKFEQKSWNIIPQLWNSAHLPPDFYCIYAVIKKLSLCLKSLHFLFPQSAASANPRQREA